MNETERIRELERENTLLKLNIELLEEERHNLVIIHEPGDYFPSIIYGSFVGNVEDYEAALKGRDVFVERVEVNQFSGGGLYVTDVVRELIVGIIERGQPGG